jgi:hypothetical protein
VVFAGFGSWDLLRIVLLPCAYCYNMPGVPVKILLLSDYHTLVSCVKVAFILMVLSHQEDRVKTGMWLYH